MKLPPRAEWIAGFPQKLRTGFRVEPCVANRNPSAEP
jgi:hypothetical protein